MQVTHAAQRKQSATATGVRTVTTSKNMSDDTAPPYAQVTVARALPNTATTVVGVSSTTGASARADNAAVTDPLPWLVLAPDSCASVRGFAATLLLAAATAASLAVHRSSSTAANTSTGRAI